MNHCSEFHQTQVNNSISSWLKCSSINTRDSRLTKILSTVENSCITIHFALSNFLPTFYLLLLAKPLKSLTLFAWTIFWHKEYKTKNLSMSRYELFQYWKLVSNCYFLCIGLNREAVEAGRKFHGTDKKWSIQQYLPVSFLQNTSQFCHLESHQYSNGCFFQLVPILSSFIIFFLILRYIKSVDYKEKGALIFGSKRKNILCTFFIFLVQFNYSLLTAHTVYRLLTRRMLKQLKFFIWFICKKSIVIYIK